MLLEFNECWNSVVSVRSNRNKLKKLVIYNLQVAIKATYLLKIAISSITVPADFEVVYLLTSYVTLKGIWRVRQHLNIIRG